MRILSGASHEKAFQLGADCALFLDLDGTLLDIAATPRAVTVPDGLVSLLGRLHERLQGALAILTGRSIRELDRLLGPLRLPAAGQHGAEMRLSSDARIEVRTVATVPGDWRMRLAAMAREDNRIVVEDKGHAVAVHYRAAPERGSMVQSVVTALAATDKRFVAQAGKEVIELRPGDADKGTALLRFMSLPPFAGRVPVALGDDLTDEAAFIAARSLGGRALKVGGASSCSAPRLSSPQDVRAWLAACLDSLSAAGPAS